MDINNWVDIGGSFAMLFVSIIALFKEQLQSCFFKVRFDVKLQNNGLDEEVVNGQTIRYSSYVEISNIGNQYAEDCSIYMESARYYPHNGNPNTPLKEIRRQITQIDWDNKNTETGIPSKGHRVIEVFRMLQPGDLNSPQSSNTNPPHYIFAGIGNEESLAGTWEIIYCICSKNGEASRFKINVIWSGEWKHRLKEMASVINVNVKMI